MCNTETIPPLVGYKEAAEIMGVDTKALAVYIQRARNGWEKFPAPVQRLASGPVWRKSDIVKFKEGL
jgi:hypothetical protein